MRRRFALASVLGLIILAASVPAPMAATPAPFSSNFGAGAPATPQPFYQPDVDVQVHSRNSYDTGGIDPMNAGHGADCSGPPATHAVGTAGASVFVCNNHLMTAQNGEKACCSGYGMTYVTPPELLDFSAPASLTYTVSTLRTSLSDWIELWVSPFADQLADPIEPQTNPAGPPTDQQGPPARGVEVLMDHDDRGQTIFNVIVYRHFVGTTYPFAAPGYESFLAPSAAQRQTFELDLSPTSVRFGMPAPIGPTGATLAPVWWVNTTITPALDWSQGVVQLGHHSYAPVADCGFPPPPGMACTPNTWHWGGITMSSGVPFGIRHPQQSGIGTGLPNTLTLPSPTVACPGPAPCSYLRFEAIGNIQYSLNGGPWQTPTKAAENFNIDGAFHNYWTPIPAGTTVTSIAFTGTDLATGWPWWVDGVSVFSLSP